MASAITWYNVCMSFEKLPSLPFHSNGNLDRDHDGTKARDPMPDRIRPRGAAEAQENVSSPEAPDLSKFDLTVDEAREAFHFENRRRPSTRTLQSYCQEGRIDCFKLKTTRDGIPHHDWIIDSTSLWEFIQSCPQNDARFTDTTSEPSGDGKIDAEARTGRENPTSTVTAPDRPCNAVKDPISPRTLEHEPEITAVPKRADHAGGVKQSCVELMIENARLTAQLDAQSKLVNELREDKRFMRDEISQQSKNDRLLAEVHRRTLQTLKAVSVAARLSTLNLPRDQSQRQRKRRNRRSVS